MTMNQIIQEKRKALGLTQEQIAECLGVSAPAVNKWEKGTTCPDISLLSPLARLLKTDLNTLLCFHESLTPQEMARYQNEISKVVQEKGIEAGFQMAREFRREYPNCDQFLYYNTMLLEGSLIMSQMTPQEKKPYNDELLLWYEHAVKSESEDTRNGALFTLASKYLNQDQIEKAQEMADLLPDHYSPNKKMLQANIYIRQERLDDAAQIVAQQTLASVTELQNTMIKLLEVEIASGEYETASQIAEIFGGMTPLFGLWEYNQYIAHLEIALAEKDAPECIRLFGKLLDTASSPWDMTRSPLFRRLPTKAPEGNQLYSKMVPALLTDLETNPQYDFLRENESFKKLLEDVHLKLNAEKDSSET